jgi:NAD(P)-dependent dehydrogenase (short-subunit alcohol dehydrogenase family)
VQRKTKQGLESHVGINYLAHYLLTRLLLPKLVQAAKTSKAKSRIVNVSSMGYAWVQEAKFQEAFYGTNEGYETNLFYGYSKLFQIYDAVTLNAGEHGEHVLAMSLHPGLVKTEIARELSKNETEEIFSDPNTKTPEEGAKSAVLCATASLEALGVAPGKVLYFYDEEGGEMKVMKLARNLEKAKELAIWSEQAIQQAKL